MIFVPEYTNSNCAYIYNSDIIRVYSRQPQHNTTVDYRDYYIKSSYIYNEGSTTFSNYSTLPVCINSNRITTNVFYRNDLSQILTILFVLLLVCFYFPYQLISRMFGRWLKW